MEIATQVVEGSHADFATLIALLDQELVARYGAAVQASFDQFNAVDQIHDVVIVYAGGAPVACGGFKALDDDTVEIKRVFVRSEHRGRGLARRLMAELERLAAGQGYDTAVLQTGRNQPEAIGLYGALGYGVTANYPPYVGDEYSICLKKTLAG